jgi:hypothetical protein
LSFEKSASVAGDEKRRTAMKIITASELANKTRFELSALYARVREELEQTEPDSDAHACLVTSLENIRRAFTAPKFKPPSI